MKQFSLRYHFTAPSRVATGSLAPPPPPLSIHPPTSRPLKIHRSFAAVRVADLSNVVCLRKAQPRICCLLLFAHNSQCFAIDVLLLNSGCLCSPWDAPRALRGAQWRVPLGRKTCHPIHRCLSGKVYYRSAPTAETVLRSIL